MGLSPTAYLSSNMLVLGMLLSSRQSASPSWRSRGSAPDNALIFPSTRLEVALAVAAVAVAVAMTVAALAVSAAAHSADQTMPALVALVMAQIVFCGGLFPLVDRTGLEQFAWVLPARFGFAAGATTISMQPPSTPGADPLFEPAAEQWLLDIGAIGLQTAAFAVLAAIFLARSVVRTGPR